MTQSQPPAWQPAPATSAAMPAEGVRYAGFWIRVVAWIIDGIALALLTTALSPFSGGTMITIQQNGYTINYAANALGTLVGLVYFVGLWSWRGQTVGMMPFGLSVVDVNTGAKPDIVRAFLRYIGLIISFVVFALGVIWVAFDGRKQGWHDKLASTVVVRR
jgi:uncharacterized RDD family membrane protein YckC